MSDTSYWAARRRAEDEAVKAASAAAWHLADELAAAAAAGFKFRRQGGYTVPEGDYAAYAAWSEQWHAAGCPAPGSVPRSDT